jgi:hypothetical protein
VLVSAMNDASSASRSTARKHVGPRLASALPPLRATRVLDPSRKRLRPMHYSLRTEEVYVYRLKAFIRFHG